MQKESSPPAPLDSQGRKRKGRNSDARKEQNRIASRAYREKRRQKLALLDEILKSDSHTDSMSSVSDETEYNSSTPAPEFQTTEAPIRNSHSSNNPTSYYMSIVPAMASLTAGLQQMPSNGSNCEGGAYVNYCTKEYGQEDERLGVHHDYPCDPSLSINSGYTSPIPSLTPVPPTPLFPSEEDLIGGAFSAYSSQEAAVPGFSATSGCDSDMINALQSISRLNDGQLQQIMAYIQKKRDSRQATNAADNSLYFGYGGYHLSTQTSNLVPGMKSSTYG